MVRRQDASTGQIVDDHEQPADKPKKASLLQVKVYSPFRVYFNDEAKSVTAENLTGPFDILPEHHNFMTLLSPCDLVIDARLGPQTIRISRGVMHVRSNKVTVFLDV